MLNDSAQQPVTLINGEVTALEAEIHQGTSFSIVRGYDESHRLLHGSVTESYQNATFADIAKKVAQRHSLKPGKIEGTSPTHPHVTQANESDWEFLRRLADRGRLRGHRHRRQAELLPPGELVGRAQRRRSHAASNPLNLARRLEPPRAARRRDGGGAGEGGRGAGLGRHHEEGARGHRRRPRPTPSPTATIRPSWPASSRARTSSPSTSRWRRPRRSTTRPRPSPSGWRRRSPRWRARPGAIPASGPARPSPSACSAPRSTASTSSPAPATPTTRSEGYTTWFTVSGRQERSLLGLTGRTGRRARAGPGRRARRRRRRRRPGPAGPGAAALPVDGRHVRQRLVPRRPRRRRTRSRLLRPARGRRRGARGVRSGRDAPPVRARRPVQRRGQGQDRAGLAARRLEPRRQQPALHVAQGPPARVHRRRRTTAASSCRPATARSSSASTRPTARSR